MRAVPADAPDPADPASAAPEKWALVIAAPETSYLMEADARAREVLAASAVVAALAALAALGLTRYALRPLRRLDTFGRKIVAGDFTARVELGTSRELVDLGAKLNRAAVLLEERVALRAAAEAAEAASRAKGLLVANLSHEFRTPLNAILGYADLLEESARAALDAGDANRAQDAEDLRRLRESANHLLHLVNDLLDLMKLEAGKVRLRPEPFDAAELAREAARAVDPLARQGGTRLDVDAPAALPVTLDRLRLRQVLLNLLSNALKFTERGTVTLRAQRVGDQLVVSVADTGVGIAADQLERLFAPYEQADRTATASAAPKLAGLGGTGLGLSVTRQLCRRMGGDVMAESRPGAGSTFTVRLPVELAYDGAAS